MSENLEEKEFNLFGTSEIINIEDVPKPDYIEELDESASVEEWWIPLPASWGRTLPLEDLGRSLPPENWGNPLPQEDWSNPLPQEDWSNPLPQEDWSNPLPQEDWSNPLPPEDWGNPLPHEDWGNPLPPEYWGVPSPEHLMFPNYGRDEYLTRDRVVWSKIFQPRIVDENNLTEEEINSLKEWFDRDIYAHLEKSQMNEEGKLELVEQVELLKERYKKLVREQTGEMIK